MFGFLLSCEFSGVYLKGSMATLMASSMMKVAPLKIGIDIAMIQYQMPGFRVEAQTMPVR